MKISLTATATYLYQSIEATSLHSELFVPKRMCSMWSIKSTQLPHYMWCFVNQITAEAIMEDIDFSLKNISQRLTY